MTPKTYILTLSCEDVRGIVAAVSGKFLAEEGRGVSSSSRRSSAMPPPASSSCALSFSTGGRKDAAWRTFSRNSIHDKVASSISPCAGRCTTRRASARVLIMVSKYGHCLNDLLHRYQAGTLPVNVAAVVSNHPDFREMVRVEPRPVLSSAD